MARVWIEKDVYPTSADVVAEIYEEFPAWTRAEDAPHDWSTVLAERHAALQLYSCTGRRPRRIDSGLRTGAVDLLLDGDDERAPTVVEVTSNTDPTAMRAYERGERLVRRIGEEYQGDDGWWLHFQRGFDPPVKRADSERLAKLIAAELGQIERQNGALTRLDSANWLYARPAGGDARGVQIASWDSRAPDKFGPYLEHVQDYLVSGLVARKIEKLARESERLGASERHLYVSVALTGEWAPVFPRHDGALAAPGLELPDGIDVLWMDTMSRSIFRVGGSDDLWIYPRAYL